MGLPETLRKLGWELPHTFLGLDEEASGFGGSKAVVLPVPYEATTSYGGGTAGGPRAILAASRYVELYDQELDADTYEVGIATLPALELSGAGGEAAMGELRGAYETLLEAAADKFIVMLGGEHSITAEPVLAWADRLAAGGRRLTVLQFDAHTDLRAEYEGSRYSHASVMHRVRDAVDIVAVGVRALAAEEMGLARRDHGIHLFLDDDIHGQDEWIDDMVRLLGNDVYITFDVDVLDPALMPSTGTPEPGGVDWYTVLRVLERVFQKCNVVAADVVELSPIPGLHAPDFLAAKLVYKMIGYRYY